MKIAATLHVSQSVSRSGEVPQIIDARWLEEATHLAFEMINKLESMLVEQGAIGQESKELYILGKFDRKRIHDSEGAFRLGEELKEVFWTR